MDDASGHYTSGFFYGNNYWMGSLSLCTSIYKTENDDGKVRDIKQNNGLPFSHLIGVNNAVINRHENPPFMPGFYVMKILMNETLLAPNVSMIETLSTASEVKGGNKTISFVSKCESDTLRQRIFAS